jgi:acyl-CoA thioesterase FadM
MRVIHKRLSFPFLPSKGRCASFDMLGYCIFTGLLTGRSPRQNFHVSGVTFFVGECIALNFMLLYTLRVTYQILAGIIVKVKPRKIQATLLTASDKAMASSPRFEGQKKFYSCLETSFRCWPLDIDFFMHMNNANYFRIAELTRWRTMRSLLKRVAVDRSQVLIAAQSVTYYKPIGVFGRFLVRTHWTYVPADDRWLYGHHAFLSHPSDVRPGDEPTVYARIILKCIWKEASGKTIRISSLLDSEDELRSIVSPEDQPPFE